MLHSLKFIEPHICTRNLACDSKSCSATYPLVAGLGLAPSPGPTAATPAAIPAMTSSLAIEASVAPADQALLQHRHVEAPDIFPQTLRKQPPPV